uniref:Uncharacterized protein n=1 Tax=Triticum urartu TaxID=4572 RepID=A0A8R7UW76_TRIUA
MEMANRVRLLGNIGIWPVSWFKVRSRPYKLVRFLNPDGIAPVMLLLERERSCKLVKCPTISGSIPVILLWFEYTERNLLDEHCGSFLKNSVMFPSARLPSSRRS